jgi:competence protein ComEC
VRGWARKLVLRGTRPILWFVPTFRDRLLATLRAVEPVLGGYHRAMVVRWLCAILVITGCGAGRARPIPPREPARPLDASFFARPANDGGPMMRVHLIDIGQGMATLVEFSCAAILIDTGGESHRRFDSTHNLMNYLRAFFASRPDLDETLALLVLTHPHIDHTRGAPIVINEFTVQNLVTDGHVTSSGGREQRVAISTARRKGIPSQAVHTRAVPPGGLTSPVIDPVACPDGDPDIRVLWGALDKDANLNNHSVVVRISLGEASILITGDLELDGIAGLLAKHRGTQVLDVDVYQVGHHGSYNATTIELLRAMTPKLALIACGPHDRRSTWTAWAYGHPRAVTIELLEQALARAPPRPAVVVPVASGTKRFEGWQITAPIYASPWDADVIVTMFADGRITARTRRQAGGSR